MQAPALGTDCPLLGPVPFQLLFPRGVQTLSRVLGLSSSPLPHMDGPKAHVLSCVHVEPDPQALLVPPARSQAALLFCLLSHELSCALGRVRTTVAGVSRAQSGCWAEPVGGPATFLEGALWSLPGSGLPWRVVSCCPCQVRRCSAVVFAAFSTS